MIIWRGWGVLGFLIPLVLAAGGAALASAIGGNPAVFVGLGIAVGGVATFFAGKWFNETNAEQKAASWRQARQQELQHLIRAGQFQVAPGYAMPRSHDEAQGQAAAMLQAEHQSVAKQLRNRHTLFWIPMQWAGVVAVVLGLAICVLMLVG